jgi:hypothetical protein
MLHGSLSIGPVALYLKMAALYGSQDYMGATEQRLSLGLLFKPRRSTLGGLQETKLARLGGHAYEFEYGPTYCVLGFL